MFGDGGFATGWNRKGGVQEGGTVMHSSSLFYDSAVPTLDEKTMPFSPLHSPR